MMLLPRQTIVRTASHRRTPPHTYRYRGQAVECCLIKLPQLLGFTRSNRFAPPQVILQTDDLVGEHPSFCFANGQ